MIRFRLPCEGGAKSDVLDLVGYYGKIKVKDDRMFLALSKWMSGYSFYGDDKGKM